jgi:YidC/Oxa1 family membrane protein insertase
MEKRAILAAVLMAALLLVYQMFFLAPAPEAPPGVQKTKDSVQPSPPVPAPAPAPVVAGSARAAGPGAPPPPARTVAVEAPVYRAVVSSEGGKLQEYVLRYRGDKPLVSVGEVGPAGLEIDAGSGRAVLPMEIVGGDLVLGSGRLAGDLVLRREYEGLRVQETLGFSASGYTIESRIRIENLGAAPRAVEVLLPWSARQTWKDATEKFPGQRPTEVVWESGGTVHRIENLTAIGQRTEQGAWIGLGSAWYLAALVPKQGDFQLVAMGDPKPAESKKAAEHEGRATIAVRATPTVAPGQAWEGTVVAYIGPKEYDQLRALGLENTINFGGFPVPRQYGGLPMEWLGVPILRLLTWVYRTVGNYGVAIILLTVISKVLFYPLTVKSIRSMKAMQVLGPQVNALRSKYKSDPQRLQKETLELYRQHKVNPMGGCLPMVAQVPIFYALYLALSVSVELQNAPFLCFGRMFGLDLWICDLASQDPTYVLPILMGVTMLIQQKMQPMTGDPRQAKMMLVMPFVFTFMFLNLPSGLVLYWTVSNILQILQQWFMDRPKPSSGAEKRSPKGAAREVKNAVRA